MKVIRILLFAVMAGLVLNACEAPRSDIEAQQIAAAYYEAIKSKDFAKASSFYPDNEQRKWLDYLSEENEKLGLAAAVMDKAGTPSFSNLDLQKEWYRMGSDFRFGSGENSSSISISGLDEQFTPTLELMLDLIRNPVSSRRPHVAHV